MNKKIKRVTLQEQQLELILMKPTKEFNGYAL